MVNDIHSTSLPNASLRVVGWVKHLWKGRITLIIALSVGLVVGIAIALLSPKEYTAWTTVVPQTADANSKLSGVSSLAAMAGFNLNLGGGDELAPAIYPQIVGSVLFQLELMHTPFTIDASTKPVDLYTYYTKYKNKGLLERLGLSKMGATRVKQRGEGKPVLLTQQEEKVSEYLTERVTLNVDVKNGYVTLYAAFPEAELSAEVVDRARELLQKYITEYKIRKTADQLGFIEERYQEKKADYFKTQRNLAAFQDNNKYLTDATSSVEVERLKGENNIAMSVYNELAKQLEQAKIQVKENTPVFSVIQPAKVPHKPTKPRRAMIVTLWLFFGLVMGVGAVFGSDYLQRIKKDWNK